LTGAVDLHHGKTKKANFDKHFDASQVEEESGVDAGSKDADDRSEVSQEVSQKPGSEASNADLSEPTVKMPDESDAKEQRSFGSKLLFDFNFRNKKVPKDKNPKVNEKAINQSNTDEDSELDQAYLYVCMSNGSLQRYNLIDHYRHFPIVVHCRKKANYNAYRIVNESFSRNIQFLKSKTLEISLDDIKNCDQMHEFLINEFQAHKEAMTSINFITMHKKYL
jgi:hypothetical protein